ncbi:MAG: SDR family NAD(P)-dependent oxidoreductase, partial [Butyrivibrio sp.]|nr:SDR family NAD(P)-dependent oxidoreductase [Butyrivibrio sp.]
MKEPEKYHYDYDEMVAKYPISNHFEGLLTGRTALITGSSKGIGLAIAKEFLAAGANCIITGRNQDTIDKALAAIDSPKLKGMCWDVSDMSVMQENFKKATELFDDPLSILVNNAGIQTPKDYDRDFFAIEEADYDKVLNINLKAMFFLC